MQVIFSFNLKLNFFLIYGIYLYQQRLILPSIETLFVDQFLTNPHHEYSGASLFLTHGPILVKISLFLSNYNFLLAHDIFIQ